MIPAHSRAALAYILAELGINVGVDSEVLNEILRITGGNVPFVLDESVHVEEDHEKAVMQCNVRDMLNEFRDVISFIMELIVVVPYDLLDENPDIMNMFTTIVLIDGTENLSDVNTEVPVLILDGKNIIHVYSKDTIAINYYDFQYVKALPKWIGLKGIFEHEYRFDEDRIRDVQNIIESSNNPSVTAIQELMDLPRFSVLIDLFLLERMEGTIVRDSVVDIVNETDGVSVSIREHVPAREMVEILAEETTLSERDLSEVVFTLLTGSERFVPVDELERKVRLGEGKLRRVLSALTRVKALSFQFDLKMPAI
ncbi:hypothetical protein [Methanopyrus sp.]